jgi:hypothetical protein
MNKRTLIVAGLFFSGSTFAATGLMAKGSDVVSLHLNNHLVKHIRFQHIELSPSARLHFSNRASEVLAHPVLLSAGAGSASYIGMNGEPVLDQGDWGTCATFATTGVLNALYGLRDDQRVSQLCNLELGKTLNNPPDSDGGWNGSSGDIVLNQIAAYGYITLSYQEKNGCGGLKAYPVADGKHNGSPMLEKVFTDNSVKTWNKANWNVLYQADDNGDPITSSQANQVLAQLKSAIDQNHRVLFGTLLDENVNQVGTDGKYYGVSQDVWVMTSRIQKDLRDNNNIGGHEIIIDGYDDHACAILRDKRKTQKQCGLLRIRNSWGPNAGYHGDYFMSYDYFKTMVDEVYEITP